MIFLIRVEQCLENAFLMMNKRQVMSGIGDLFGISNLRIRRNIIR
jgi:hypothetical protein